MKYLSSFNGKDDIGFSFKQARNKDFNTSLFFCTTSHFWSRDIIYIYLVYGLPSCLKRTMSRI